MKKRLTICLLLALAMLSFSIPRAKSQQIKDDDVLVPDSTKEGPFDIGERAHTNHLIKLARPEGGLGRAAV
jgi:hypothetical protein